MIIDSLAVFLEYLLRFAHLVSGIAWIGSSFYFIWLDNAFRPPGSPRHNVDGEVFMVHGGFYYQVDKKRLLPGEIPKTLHWFKWEATLTWVTGIFLFGTLYWMKGAALLVDSSVFELTQSQAIGVSLAIIVGSWVAYDFLWHPSIERFLKLRGVLTLFLLSVLLYSLPKLFSGRGSFMMAGVILGTCMFLNVWVRILPGQKRMLEQAQAGKLPDLGIGLKSKTRSVHNTYIIFPVLLIMLSNHYPLIANHTQSGFLLMLLTFAGALIRHATVANSFREKWTILPALLFLGLAVFILKKPDELNKQDLPPITYSKIRTVFENRCLSCHASRPTDKIFTSPPKGAVFETEEQILKNAALVDLHVFQARTMPLGNLTKMTEDERRMVHDWINQRKKPD